MTISLALALLMQEPGFPGGSPKDATAFLAERSGLFAVAINDRDVVLPAFNLVHADGRWRISAEPARKLPELVEVPGGLALVLDAYPKTRFDETDYLRTPTHASLRHDEQRTEWWVEASGEFTMGELLDSSPQGAPRRPHFLETVPVVASGRAPSPETIWRAIGVAAGGKWVAPEGAKPRLELDAPRVKQMVRASLEALAVYGFDDEASQMSRLRPLAWDAVPEGPAMRKLNEPDSYYRWTVHPGSTLHVLAANGFKENVQPRHVGPDGNLGPVWETVVPYLNLKASLGLQFDYHYLDLTVFAPLVGMPGREGAQAGWSYYGRTGDVSSLRSGSEKLSSVSPPSSSPFGPTL